MSSIQRTLRHCEEKDEVPKGKFIYCESRPSKKKKTSGQ